MSPYRSDLAAMVRRRAALVRELRDLDVALNERTAAATPRPSRWAAWRLRRALRVLERYGPGASWTWLLRRLLGDENADLPMIGEAYAGQRAFIQANGIRYGKPTTPRPPAPAPEPETSRVDLRGPRRGRPKSMRVDYEDVDGKVANERIAAVDLASGLDRTAVAVVDRELGVVEFDVVCGKCGSKPHGPVVDCPGTFEQPPPTEIQ